MNSTVIIRILTSHGWRNREPDDTQLVDTQSLVATSTFSSVEEHVMYTMHLPSFSSSSGGRICKRYLE